MQALSLFSGPLILAQSIHVWLQEAWVCVQPQSSGNNAWVLPQLCMCVLPG